MTYHKYVHFHFIQIKTQRFLFLLKLSAYEHLKCQVLCNCSPTFVFDLIAYEHRKTIMI